MSLNIKYAPLFSLAMRLIVALLGTASVALGQASQAPATYVTDRNVSYYDEEALRAGDDYQRDQCKLDLLRPTNRPGFATVVWLHSGGLIAGKRGFPRLQGQEIALVAVDYRLSPKAEFPSFLEDAAAATAWVMRNIESLGGDPNKVFIGGASAGAYLAAMVQMDPRWLAAHDLSNRKLAGLLSVTGQMTTHFTVKKLRGDMGPELRPIIDEYAPIYYASRDLPPICLITGGREIEYKNRVEENSLMATVLRNFGHPWVEFHEMGGLNHETVSEAAGIILRRFVKEVVRDIDGRKPVAELPLVFADDFSGYVSPESLEATWNKVSGRIGKVDTSPAGGHRLVLDNAVVSRSLPAPIGKGFSIEARLLHSAYARAQWFGLFNENLSQGYVVLWDSGRAETHESMGVVSIRKVKVQAGAPLEFNGFQRDGWSLLTKPTLAVRPAGELGRRAISGPAAKIMLTWDKDTGRLELRMDGKLIDSVVDPEFDHFSRVVLEGNSSGLYEAVTVRGN